MTGLRILDWYRGLPEDIYQLQGIPQSTCKIRALQVLSDWQKTNIQRLLQKYPKVIDNKRLGKTNIIEHTIDLDHKAPKFLKPFPVSDKKHKIIDDLVEEMLQQGLVEESKSPYASPLLLRPKPNGDWRIVNDYRYINNLTTPDGFPMRKVHDVLRVLGGAQYLSTLDLEKGFWQVQLREKDRPYTAFRTRKGHFQYTVMPQGLKNSPATFQRLMNKVLKELDDFAFPYQDDILIFSKSFEDHLRHIDVIMQRLQAANLTVKSDKCQFGLEKVKFLGHIISTKGIETNPDKVNSVLELRPPTSRRQLRSFLGAMGWFRHFIPSMANVSLPLYNLLKLKSKFRWDESCQQAFDALKNALSSAASLTHPNFEKPFIIRTDAADGGIGAVLLQLDANGQETPIAFASKTLTDAQKRYSAIEKECFAIVFSLEHFAEYIDGCPVEVQTDNEALTSLPTMRNTNSRLMNWSGKISEWSPTIIHIKGRDNPTADYLSRHPLPPQVTSDGPAPVINAVIQPTTKVTLQQIRQAQLHDDECQQLHTSNSTAFPCIDGVIHKVTPTSGPLPFIPSPLRALILSELHDHPSSGHLGISKTLACLQSRVFFPKMNSFVESYVKTCDLCQRHKYSNLKPPGHMSLKPVTAPWHTLYMDLLGPYSPSSSARFTYVFVIVDGFSKFVELHPIRDATSSTVARILEKEIFCRYGLPHTIVTDNATTFKSGLMEKLCSVWGVKHSFTSPYHPQTNLAERINRTLKPMLRMHLDTLPHNKWSQHLRLFQLAINSAKHDSSKFSPSEALSNYPLRLPLDNQLQSGPSACDDEDTDIDDAIIMRQSKFQEILAAIRHNLSAAQQSQKKNYDSKRQPSHFHIGDSVVLRNVTLSSKQKGIVGGLTPLYSNPVGTLSKQLTGNTFEVSLPDGSKKSPVHIDHLRLYSTRPALNTPADGVLTTAELTSTGSSVTPFDSTPRPASPVRVLRPRRDPKNYRDLHLGRTTRISRLPPNTPVSINSGLAGEFVATTMKDGINSALSDHHPIINSPRPRLVITP